MNIYKTAVVSRRGRAIGQVVNYDTLDGVSTLLWAEDIPHESKLSIYEDQDKLEILEIQVEKDTLDKLLEHYVIDIHEYNRLYQAHVDFIDLI
jgi:hypothetical protein